MGRDEQEATKVSDRRTGSTTAAEAPQPVSFEDGLSRLADLVGGLEGGRLGLAESIAAYEQGVSLVRRLHAELADVEQRVKTLTAAAEKASEEDEEDDGPMGEAPADSVPHASASCEHAAQRHVVQRIVAWVERSSAGSFRRGEASNTHARA